MILFSKKLLVHMPVSVHLSVALVPLLLCYGDVLTLAKIQNNEKKLQLIFFNISSLNIDSGLNKTSCGLIFQIC